MASIQPRKNKAGQIISYQIKVTRGRDPLSGKQLTPYTMTFNPPPTWDTWSRKAKERKLQEIAGEFEASCKNGTVLTKEERFQKAVEEAKEPSFSEYADSFLKAGIGSKSINTKALYGRILDRACAEFGQIKMKDITPLLLKNYLSSLQNDEKSEATGKPFSHSTIKAHYKCLHALFGAAVDDEIIPYSPMQRMKAPKPRKDEEISQPLSYTADQIKYILECLENEPIMWRAWMWFAIDSGCRNGEIVGLQWKDIDFDTGAVTISRNAQSTSGNGTYITTPKNKQRRSFFLNPPALATLKKWRAVQRTMFFQMGVKNEDNWVFTQNNGKMIHPGSPRTFLIRFGERYNLPGIHPHALRHTMATLSISNGADVVSVSKKLGHSSPSITLNVYAHANEEAQRKTNEALASAIYETKQA